MRNFKVLKLSIKDEINKLALLDKEKNALLKRRAFELCRSSRRIDSSRFLYGY